MTTSFVVDDDQLVNQESFYVGAATYEYATGSMGMDRAKTTVRVEIPVTSSYSREMGNILVVGPPGSGKTNLLLINLCLWKHSAICNDIKGDIFTRTAVLRSRHGQKIFVLDPKNGTGHRFNPVQAVPPELRHQLAIELVGDTSSDTFWQGTAVSFWLAAWAAADHAQQPHIPYALELIALGVTGAQEHIRRRHGQDKETMQHANAFFGNDPRLASNKWASVTASAQPLYNQHIINIFSGHDLDPARLFYEPITVYIQADETNKVAFELFTRLVTKSIGEAMIREADRTTKKRNPVLFLYDEFGRAPLVDVMSWLDVMRARDIILVLFCQKLSQLASTSEKKPYSFYTENSFNHLIIFKPTIPGNELYDLIEKIGGHTTLERLPCLPVGDGAKPVVNPIKQGSDANFPTATVMKWQKFNALAVINTNTTELYIVDPRPAILKLEWIYTAPLPALPTTPASRVRKAQDDGQEANIRAARPASRINLDALDL